MKTDSYVPRNGQIALKLLVAKCYRTGMEVRKHEIERRIEQTVTLTGLPKDEIAELFSLIMIPAAGAGAVPSKNGKLTNEKLAQLVQGFTNGNRACLEKLEKTSLAVVRLEGRHLSIAEFEDKLSEHARSTGIGETELREFYLYQILLPAIGHLFGCHNVGITMTNESAPAS